MAAAVQLACGHRPPLAIRLAQRDDAVRLATWRFTAGCSDGGAGARGHEASADAALWAAFPDGARHSARHSAWVTNVKRTSMVVVMMGLRGRRASNAVVRDDAVADMKVSVCTPSRHLTAMTGASCSTPSRQPSPLAVAMHRLLSMLHNVCCERAAVLRGQAVWVGSRLLLEEAAAQLQHLRALGCTDSDMCVGGGGGGG